MCWRTAAAVRARVRGAHQYDLIHRRCHTGCAPFRTSAHQLRHLMVRAMHVTDTSGGTRSNMWIDVLFTRAASTTHPRCLPTSARVRSQKRACLASLKTGRRRTVKRTRWYHLASLDAADMFDYALRSRPTPHPRISFVTINTQMALSELLEEH